MRKCLFISFLCVSISSFSQDLDDTISKRKSFYSRFTPLKLLSFDKSGNSLFNDRIAQTLEGGISYQVLDFGICYTRNVNLNYDNGTTRKTSYLEGKVIMDACQYGIFSNELCIGLGYSLNSSNTIMIEYSTTILAQPWKDLAIGMEFGTYDLTNDKVDFNKSFVGMFFRYGLLRDNGGMLVNRKRMTTKKVRRPMKHI